MTSMSIFQERLEDERRHLLANPLGDERPRGRGTVRFIAHCKGNASQVLDNVKSVIKVVNENTMTNWLSTEQWRAVLPKWFVEACAPERTKDEVSAELARWRSLSPSDQAAWERERQWSVGDWIHWMMPSNRVWFWWGGIPLDTLLIVAVDVIEWPFGTGSLEWLLRAAGADRVEAEE